jgi:uncharacterized protein YbjT (DUF2867 family)
MTILVTGARGNVGRRVLHRLYAAGHSLRASGRTPSELDVPDGVAKVRLDLNDPSTFPAAFEGVTEVLLYAEPDGVEELMKAAKKAGVRHIVLLSSNTADLPDPENDPLGHHHIVVEKALVASGISYTLLRPGAFCSNAIGWSYLIQQGVIDQVFPDAHTVPIHEDDIADVAVVALTEQTLVNEVVDLCGPESLTFRRQLAIIAEVTGRDIEVRELTRAQGEEQMSAWVEAPILASLLAQWEAADGKPLDAGATAERITGKPARTFRQWVEENAALFGAAA